MSIDLKPIKTKKIYEEIVDQIKQLISEGRIKPGDRLPSEKQLMESFKVSRASIREALSALETMGLVEVRAGEGSYIRQAQVDAMENALSWALLLDKESVIELLEARKIIEVQAAGLASIKATEHEIQQMGITLYNMENSLHISQRDVDRADHSFHYQISQATHNKIVIRIMDTISEHVQILIRANTAIRKEENELKSLVEDHQRIFDAIRRRDPKEAEKQMKLHLNGVEAEVLKTLK